MAASNGTAEVSKYAGPTLMTGELPDDFLRISGDTGPAVAQGQVQYPVFNGFQRAGGLLTITVVQARLAKNYGVTRMDPYCKIKIGVQVFETPTVYNGAKAPRWNKVMQCYVPQEVKELYLEIYDERTFSIDERIAWSLIQIKDDVFKNGETLDEWYPLNGKQGDEKEGMIQLVFQYRKSEGAPVLMGGSMVMNPMGAPQMVYGYPPVMYAPPMMVPQMPMQPAMMQQQQQQAMQSQTSQQQQNTFTAPNQKDLQTLKEMCPELDEEIIKTVLQQSGGNVDRAAAQLLEMSSS